MTASIRRQLLAATALALSAFQMPTRAAEPAAPAITDQDQTASGALSEIVVTAQKREENLQKTPISISVLKGEDIADRHIQSLLDLQDGSIPSLRVLPFSGRNFSLVLNIRGVGVMGDTNQPGRDSGVGVYIDGVYLGRPQGLNGALYDVESIEVLKGPQGTLFGRNTEGGALNITTKKPTGKFGLSLTAGAGNYGSYETELHLNTPEYHNIALKLDGLITSRDGTIRNTYPGASDFNGYNRRGVRVQAKWQPLPNFYALYAYDNIYDSSTVGYEQRTATGTAFVPAAALQPDRADVVAYGLPLQPSIGKQDGHTLTLKWDPADHLTVKSISSYRELSQTQYDDGGMAGGNYVTTATPNGLSQHDNVSGRYSLAAFYQYQYSQELQVLGDLGSRIKFIVGGLAYHEHVRDQAQAYNTGFFNSAGQWIVELPSVGNLMNNYTLPGTTTPLPVTSVVNPLNPYVGVDRASIARTNSFGVYGQATWTPPILDDRAHLTGGLRWNDDDKKGTLLLYNNYSPPNGGKYTPISYQHTWKRVDPMVNLAIDVARDVSIYGKWGTGYKSGGANSRSQNFSAFGPESVSMFEVGLKSEFFDHHVRFNVAGYTGVYKGQQVDFSVPYFCFDSTGHVITCPSSGGITTRTTTNTYNTPENGRVSGIEAELTIAPVRGLTLLGAYTYAYTRVGDAVNPYPQQQADGTSIINLTPTPQNALLTPRHSASGQIDYETSIGAVTARAHIDGAWDSGSYINSTPPVITSGIIGYNPRSESGLVVNTRLSVGDIGMGNTGARLTFAFWVRNLFNEQHLVARNYTVAQGIYGYFNDPRTFGGQVNVKF